MARLGTEILSFLVQGPVVVIVDSRQDAATALLLGATETVRVAQSVALRKSTLKSAVERAMAHPRTSLFAGSTPQGAYPGLALLMRMVEKRLSGPLNEAAQKCSELAEELSRAVAAADGLMQRARSGSAREELKGWSREVKHYAQATLRAEALVSELRDQVERGDIVTRLLGDLSVGSDTTKTDVAWLLPQLADLLRADLGERILLDVAAIGPSFVEVPRPALLCIVCAGVENALDNIRANGDRGHLELRASGTGAEVLIEVADDGIPNATDLRVSIMDPIVADSRTTRLRQLRERVRGLDGELTVDADDTGTVLSIYLPACSEPATIELEAGAPRTHLLRGDH
jgi:hypothetical protein